METVTFALRFVSCFVRNLSPRNWLCRARTPQHSISINAYGFHVGIGGDLPAFAEIGGVLPVNVDTDFCHNIANFTIPSGQIEVNHDFSIVCFDASTCILCRDASTLRMMSFVGLVPWSVKITRTGKINWSITQSEKRKICHKSWDKLSKLRSQNLFH